VIKKLPFTATAFLAGCLLMFFCFQPGKPLIKADLVKVTVIENGEEFPYMKSQREEVVRYFQGMMTGKSIPHPDCSPDARVEFLGEGQRLRTMELTLDRSSNCWAVSWQEGEQRITKALTPHAADLADELLRIARKRHDVSYLTHTQVIQS
jgi:hypothetical protein